jgi:hypothetical protein
MNERDDEEVDPGENADDLEDERGEKTGRDLEDISEEDLTTMPADGDDEKVKQDRGEVA